MSEHPHEPGPVSALWEWQYEGACVGMDSSTFFHPEGERGSTRRRRDEEAKAVCRTCPVIIDCREHALRAREPYGVWGGMTEEERRDWLAAGSRRPAERLQTAAVLHPSRAEHSAQAAGSDPSATSAA